MRQVRLGQTELKVSAVAFGTWAFGGDWGTADLEESKAAQLDGTAAAVDRHLSPEDLGEIDAILAGAAPVWGPHPEGM